MAIIMYNFNTHRIEYHDISSSAVYFDGTNFYISPAGDYKIVKFLTTDTTDYNGADIDTKIVLDITPDTRNVKKVAHKIEVDFDGSVVVDALNEEDTIGLDVTLTDYRYTAKFNLPFEVLTMIIKGFNTLRSLFVEYFERTIKNKKEE